MTTNIDVTLASLKAAAEAEAESILIYYDGPRLITTHTTEGQGYIGVQVDETENSGIWLYAMANDDKLVYIVAGLESLREVLTNGNYRVFRVELFYDDETLETTVTEVIPSEIQKDWLPSANSFL